MSEPKVILQAVFTEDKKINLNLYSNHIPSLCLLLKMLDFEINKMMVDERIEKSQSERKIIPGNGGGGGIINFIRRGVPRGG